MSFQSLPNSIKNAAKALLDPLLRVPDRSARHSYSQEGEDLVILRSMILPERGFYVDVGAHHPVRYSNTNLFHRMGWRGINIDPMPGTQVLFDKLRPNDVNIECGVSESPGEATYFMFNDPALNGFDETVAAQRTEAGSPHHLVGRRQIPILRLDELLRLHLPANTTIDILNVDVEGYDLQVLRSSDWTNYRPRIALVEGGGEVTLEAAIHSPTSVFLQNQGYVAFAKTGLTVLYANNDRIRTTSTGFQIV